jgi:fructokinase
MTGLLAGIDLGGTKTEGVLLSPDGTEVLRHRVNTIPNDYAATLSTIEALVQHLEREAGIDIPALGIGIPGSVSARTGRVRNANSTWINDRPLGVDLEARLRRPVRLSNDANCLALSEAFDGAAKGKSSVFAIILGTGVGGGIVLNGRLIAGAQGIAGEWGHVPLASEPVMPPCFCGRAGCNEQFLSGPAILRHYFERSGDHLHRVETILERAEAGDKTAKAVLELHLERTARALGSIVNILDPEVIVLGGGVSLLPGFCDKLAQALRAHIFAPENDRIVPDIRLAKWGDSSGVRGAARLWQKEIP